VPGVVAVICVDEFRVTDGDAYSVPSLPINVTAVIVVLKLLPVITMFAFASVSVVGEIDAIIGGESIDFQLLPSWYRWLQYCTPSWFGWYYRTFK